MTAPRTTAAKRPTRAILTLTVVIVLGLGITAYLVNFPLPWIVVGEVLAMLGLAWRVSRLKQAQPSDTGEPEVSSKG